MSSRRLTVATSVLATCAAGAALLGGCSHKNTSTFAIRSHPSPNSMTLHERPADIANTLAFTRDTNLRMMMQDLGRVFYTDRPSMLTPEPMPH